MTPALRPRIFHRITWQGEEATIDDIRFVVAPGSPRPPLSADSFQLLKGVEYFDAYERLLASVPNPRTEHVFELGIWDGASAVIFSECLQPAKLVAIDLMTRGDSEYFVEYLKKRDKAGSIKTFWGVDQSDIPKLRKLAEEELDGSIDLVVDDASHLYRPTLRSFQALFPLVRPGGLYVIEDWTWKAVPELEKHFPPDEPGLIELTNRLVRFAARRPDVIARIEVLQPLVGLERGSLGAAEAARALQTLPL